MDKKAALFDVTTITKALSHALVTIEEKLDKEGLVLTSPLQWQEQLSQPNPKQTEIIAYFKVVNPSLKNLPELKAWASNNVDKLNRILSEHGFSIKLRPWQGTNTFGVVAILDLTMKWLVRGDEFVYGDKRYLIDDKPAFRLDGKQNQISFSRVEGLNTPLVKIPTQTPGDFLCLVKAESGPVKQFQIFDEIERLSRLSVPYGYYNSPYSGVILPNIRVDQQVDISWLIGLWTTDLNKVKPKGKDANHSYLPSDWTISQALMQAKFALGAEGARAKTAVAIAVTRTIMASADLKIDYIVNHDVYIWMTRFSMPEVPLFVAYVPKDEFSQTPVSLDSI